MFGNLIVISAKNVHVLEEGDGLFCRPPMLVSVLEKALYFTGPCNIRSGVL